MHDPRGGALGNLDAEKATMKRMPIHKISDRQKGELARRRALKRELLAEAPRDAAGEQPLCTRCMGRPDFRGLQLVHLKSLGAGGKTTRENCRLWCAPCHFGPDGHRTEGMDHGI